MITVVKRALIRGSFSLFACLCCTIMLVSGMWRHLPAVDFWILIVMAIGNGFFCLWQPGIRRHDS